MVLRESRYTGEFFHSGKLWGFSLRADFLSPSSSIYTFVSHLGNEISVSPFFLPFYEKLSSSFSAASRSFFPGYKILFGRKYLESYSKSLHVIFGIKYPFKCVSTNSLQDDNLAYFLTSSPATMKLLALFGPVSCQKKFIDEPPRTTWQFSHPLKPPWSAFDLPFSLLYIVILVLSFSPNVCSGLICLEDYIILWTEIRDWGSSSLDT